MRSNISKWAVAGMDYRLSTHLSLTDPRLLCQRDEERGGGNGPCAENHYQSWSGSEESLFVVLRCFGLWRRATDWNTNIKRTSPRQCNFSRSSSSPGCQITEFRMMASHPCWVALWCNEAWWRSDASKGARVTAAQKLPRTSPQMTLTFIIVKRR